MSNLPVVVIGAHCAELSKALETVCLYGYGLPTVDTGHMVNTNTEPGHGWSSVDEELLDTVKATEESIFGGARGGGSKFLNHCLYDMLMDSKSAAENLMTLATDLNRKAAAEKALTEHAKHLKHIDNRLYEKSTHIDRGFMAQERTRETIKGHRRARGLQKLHATCRRRNTKKQGERVW